MKVTNWIIGLGVLVIAQLVCAQNQPPPQAPEISLGENTKLSVGGLFTFGYTGDYGDVVSSDHGLTFGVDRRIAGYYYNPNFISFTATPYYNQSRDNSNYQSLTGASGGVSTVNLFKENSFSGSVSVGALASASAPSVSELATPDWMQVRRRASARR